MSARATMIAQIHACASTVISTRTRASAVPHALFLETRSRWKASNKNLTLNKRLRHSPVAALSILGSSSRRAWDSRSSRSQIWSWPVCRRQEQAGRHQEQAGQGKRAGALISRALPASTAPSSIFGCWRPPGIATPQSLCLQRTALFLALPARAAPGPGTDRCLCRQDDHLRLDRRLRVKVHHVLTEQAYTAARDA